MYTTAKIAEPWRRLFPSIKQNGNKLKINLRGVEWAIAIEARRTQTNNTKIIQLR